MGALPTGQWVWWRRQVRAPGSPPHTDTLTPNLGGSGSDFMTRTKVFPDSSLPASPPAHHVLEPGLALIYKAPVTTRIRGKVRLRVPQVFFER